MSLIELMVAMLISAIMLSGVAVIYTAQHRSYDINTEMAGMQENARFALHTLNTAIRMAGNTGCMLNEDMNLLVASRLPAGHPYEVDNNRALEEVNPADANEHFAPISSFNRNTYLTGHSNDGGNWTPGLGIFTPPNFVNDTDAILIRKAGACTASVTDASNPRQLRLASNCNFNQGDAVIVNNCTNAALFTITNDPQGVATPQLNFENGQNDNPDQILDLFGETDHITVAKAEAIIYYIGSDNLNRSHLYSLNLSDPNAVPVPLIPNVEDMVITYGVDLDGDDFRSMDQDLTAEQVNAIPPGFELVVTDVDHPNEIVVPNVPMTPWSRIIRINMQLLIASEEVGTTDKQFNFDGQNYNDTRSRRVFNTVINIRNRTL